MHKKLTILKNSLLQNLLNIFLIAAIYLITILLSVIAPVSSYFIAGASAMSAVMSATHFTALPIIIIGNIIYIVVSCFSKKTTNNLYIIFNLISASVLKWLFMLLTAEFILKPIFSEAISGKTAIIFTKLFGSLQLTAALAGSLIFLILNKILKKGM